MRNACVHLGADGRVRAVYRKIHLFDVDLTDGTSLRESATVEPGSEPVVTDTRFGKLGLSVCYDLRFPELYRALVDRGAIALAIPAAFTLTTGKDHWHVLLRARAIEAQCYVIAAAQTGRHFGTARLVRPRVDLRPVGHDPLRVRRRRGLRDRDDRSRRRRARAELAAEPETPTHWMKRRDAPGRAA